jgi:glycosyltransferase involved in cell wall biosynthesis
MSKEQKGSATQATISKSLRPALIASEHTVSEYFIFLGHLLTGLADESIPTALVCPPDYDVHSIVPPSVEIIRHPAFKLPILWHQNRKRLTEQLTKFEPTVLHCLCESKAPLTSQLARQLDLPYVLTVNSLQKRWGKFYISAKHCAKIIVPAESIAAHLAKTYPKFIGRIEQINVGTFVAKQSICFDRSSRLPSMVVAHPLDSMDNLENLFAAVRHLAIDGYEFMLVIIGSGRADRQLRKLLSALSLLDIVISVPKLQPWRAVLAAGDIFIQPAASNAFNPLLLEAMSVGTAVASCKGGVDDVIIKDRTAVVFDPNDELSIYGSLQRLFSKPELARQLATSAQEYLRENHTVSNMISAILRTYRGAMR